MSDADRSYDRPPMGTRTVVVGAGQLGPVEPEHTRADIVERLVALLRDTLPIVTELEYIRVSASKAGDHVETFVKTAGCYRVLFGDRRYVCAP